MSVAQMEHVQSHPSNFYLASVGQRLNNEVVHKWLIIIIQELLPARVVSYMGNNVAWTSTSVF
jgi:hypothetical protein